LEVEEEEQKEGEMNFVFPDEGEPLKLLEIKEKFLKGRSRARVCRIK